MVKKILLLFSSLICFLFVPLSQAHAVENPLSRPNNKIGIHILFGSELAQAAQLINSNGGDWGYVTIPIQITDRDKIKWQQFMGNAKRMHVIPILRLSTEIDPANPKAWRIPTRPDIVTFTQFLHSLDWPTKNRYVIVFNEVNRGDEWGDKVNPQEYADILSFTTTVLKSKSPDYFIISAGLDNAAPNQPPMYMNQFDYMQQMNAAVPGIFNQIDGIASHSYSNPGFSQPPDAASSMGVASFKFERDLAKSLSGKDLPVFITEAGWDVNTIGTDTATTYYQQVFDSIWNDPSIVAVTPFLLNANGGPFQKFSFITADGKPTKQYAVINGLLKTKGLPLLPPTPRVLAAETKKVRATPPPAKKEKVVEAEPEQQTFTTLMHTFIKWFIGRS